MDTFQQRIDKAMEIGREIRRLEQAKTVVENEIQTMKDSLSRIDSLLSQCWIKEGELKHN